MTFLSSFCFQFSISSCHGGERHGLFLSCFLLWLGGDVTSPLTKHWIKLTVLIADDAEFFGQLLADESEREREN